MKRTFGLYYFLMFAGMAVSQPFLSLYLSNQGVSSLRIGLIFAVGNIAGIVAQPILGFLTDHLNDARRLLLISAILSPVAFFGYSLTKTFFVLIVVASLVAFIQSTAPIADSLTLQAGSQFGFNYGEIRLWGALSFALVSILAGYVYHQLGIDWMFYVFAFVSVLLAWVSWGFPTMEKPTPHHSNSNGSPWKLLVNLKLSWFILICFILSIAMSINFTFLPIYFKLLHYPLGWVGANFTVAALVEVPLFQIADKLMAVIGHRRTFLIGAVAYCSKYVLMALAPGAVWVILFQVLDGIAFAMYWSASVHMIADLAPRGRVTSAQTLFGAMAGNGSLSGIVGFSVGGWLIQRFGPTTMYGTMAGIDLVSILAFLAFVAWYRNSDAIDQTGQEMPGSP